MVASSGSAVALTVDERGVAVEGNRSLASGAVNGDSRGAPIEGFFTENRGQLGNEAISFYGTSGRLRVGFAESAVLLAVAEPASVARDPNRPATGAERMVEPSPNQVSRGVLVKLTFEGSHPVLPEGRGELPHRLHFFLGRDPAGWRTDVRSFAEVVYANLYDEIDLVYRAGPAGPKYEFLVRPGADPAQIRIAYEGMDGLEVHPDGLVLHTAVGAVRDGGLVATSGGASVPCAFVSRGPRATGFACSGWDGSEALIIDPLLTATYLGGSGLDSAYAFAVDSLGRTVVVGETFSADFPATPGAFDIVLGGGNDAYVAKLSADSSALLWATFLGGASTDEGFAVALDGADNPVLTGGTRSADFPATAGAYDTTHAGLSDAFVAKLSPDGAALLWATYLGGLDTETGGALALDGSANAVVAGATFSADFPTTLGAYDTTLGGTGDAFVAKVSADGAALISSTYLGGSGFDQSTAFVLDGSGNAVVAGSTSSGDFPASPGAFDTTFNGGSRDGFVAKVSGDGTALLWATYLGGGGSIELALGLTLNGTEHPIVAGETDSADFPATPGAYAGTLTGGSDAFVAKLSSDGAVLVWATYLGGLDYDSAATVALDGGENPFVGGTTVSPDFPATPGAFDTTLNGTDAFVGKLSVDATSLSWATFLGGSGTEEFATDVSIDGSGNALVLGGTDSPDFPVTPGAYDTTQNGAGDAFLARLSVDPLNLPPVANAGPDQNAVRNATVILNGSASSDPESGPLSFNWTFEAGPEFPTITNATQAVASFVATMVGTYTLNLTVTDNTMQSDYDLVDIVVGNRIPIADAGADRMSVRNATAALDGNGSVDPDGDLITFSWAQLAGPNGLAITNATQAVASVVPTMVGTYTFNLTVTDAFQDTDYDWVDVVVSDRGPVADAGPDQGAFENTWVALNGSASMDPDGDPLTYAWTQTSGPVPVTISNSTSAIASFTTPNGASASGVYTFNLTVRDPFGAMAMDWTNVTVSNRAPIADAGTDQFVVGGFSVVTLSGSNSRDPDEEPLTYFWSQTGGPGPVTFTAQSSVVTNFTAVGLGTYMFDLFVNDPELTNRSDSVVVTVTNAPPNANLTVTPNPVLAGVSANVNASLSADTDGSITQFAFAFGDGTVSGNVTTPLVTHAWASAGTYVVNVTVWDDAGGSNNATVLVTVFTDLPPTAAAAVTPGTTGNLSTQFTFNSSGSTDDNGIVRWLWEFGDGSNATTATATHTYATRATFDVNLTVWDALNQSDTDTVAVNVLNRLPTANAGPDQTAPKRTLVTLNASLSSDADLDALTFSWSQVSGPPVTLAGATTATPTFTPSTAGVYVFQVDATDGLGAPASDTTTVTATNALPTANAGPDRQGVPVGTNVTLDGGLSTDPDGDPLTYTWTQTSGPSVTLVGADTATPRFTPTVPGTYVFSLTVSDGTSTSAPDTVAIDVAPGAPPRDDLLLWILVILVLLVLIGLIARAAVRRGKRGRKKEKREEKEEVRDEEGAERAEKEADRPEEKPEEKPEDREHVEDEELEL